MTENKTTQEVRVFLTLVRELGTLAFILAILFFDIQIQGVKEIALLLMGCWISNAKDSSGFWFGNNSASESKDRAIAKMQDKPDKKKERRPALSFSGDRYEGDKIGEVFEVDKEKALNHPDIDITGGKNE